MEIREENLAWRFRLQVHLLELYFKVDLISLIDLLSKSNSDWSAANFSSIFAECSNVGEEITDISAIALGEHTALLRRHFVQLFLLLQRSKAQIFLFQAVSWTADLLQITAIYKNRRLY